ncbi:MAG: ankyrin repeat domain-containing protein [Candidatus Dependentiae bacterium]|nr:ankyrin repeat domain-containing protein [Candidatus Dependentiae bacterium]
MKKSIFAIVLGTCFVLVGLKYVRRYINQKDFQRHAQIVQIKARHKKMDARNKEISELVDRVLHYSNQNESDQSMSQKDLAQYAFFKNIDSELDEKVIVANAELLLNTGLIDINAYNNRDQTALFVAAGNGFEWNGQSDLVKLLLDRGASVNQYSQKGSLLPLSAAFLRPKNVKLLLEHGANPNLPLYDGTTVLMPVFWFFDFAMQHEKPIRTIENGKAIIDLLLAHGADPMLTDKNGKSAMDVLNETQEYYKTGKIKIGDQDINAFWVVNWSANFAEMATSVFYAAKTYKNRLYMLKILQEIENAFKDSIKLSSK